MGIIGTILGKREPVVEYRTIDGGHPAPYPDMTDEQLYNYEVAFNLPKKTFDKPPVAQRQRKSVPKGREERRLQGMNAALADDPKFVKPDSEVAYPEYSARANESGFHAASGAIAADTILRKGSQRIEPVTEINPRTASKSAKIQPDIQHVVAPQRSQPAVQPLDLTRPVRTITTRQPVEIITTRARHPVYKVHGYIGDDEVVTVFTEDGRLSENGPLFLENAPLQEQLHLNFYANRDPLIKDKYLVTQHASREEADAAAMPGRLACMPVDLAG